ncbi:murein biosynthesis integral membrane protein MurJ [Wolbachia endosymbiont of Pentidionis agamae]|uniref:murein biosynthesis integral membrane protein MurJ n=1 Tax=Wolbachia endosymbiont of Pentidionis agamae TaxID=3110435 RepID=UPI002FD3D083
MFKNIFTFSFFTAISRISGLIRDISIANIIGASLLTDIFFSSFRLTNLFRAFFAEGAFTTAFIPLYSAKLYDKKLAYSFASKILSITSILLILFCLMMQILTPHIIKIFSPGFVSSLNKFTLAVTLSRIMLPYILLISIASLIGGMLQVNQNFIPTAISPIILNLCLIASLFIPYVVTPAHNLAIAVLIGGIMQIILMIFSSYKLNINLCFNFKIDSEVKIFFKQSVPAIISNCMTQISVWIDTIMASMIPNAVSYIYYADRINQLPQGMIGTAIGTVLLPLISQQKNDTENIIKIQNKAMNIGLILIIPITAGLLIIPDIILTTLFSYGKFDPYAVQQTVPTLVALSLSSVPFTINKVLLPTFYMKGNFKIPTLFSIFCLLINILINIVLMNKRKHTGIAIATTTSTWIYSILLITYLKKNNLYNINQSILNIIKVLISTAIMSLFLFIISNSLADMLYLKTIYFRFTVLLMLVLISAIIYLFTLCILLKKDLNDIKLMFKQEF